MAKNKMRLIQIEDAPATLTPGTDVVRYVPLTHHALEIDHKGEEMQDGELGYQYPPWMQFMGEYNPGQVYYKNQVAIDGCWTMIAKEETNEPPAPQPDGDPFWYAHGDAPPWTTSQFTSAAIMIGQVYKFSAANAVQVSAIRVWVIAGDAYRIFQGVVASGLDPIVDYGNLFVAQNTGWLIITSPPRIISGDIDLYVGLTHYAQGGTTQFTGNWNYTTPQNPGPPAAGQVRHANSAVGLLQVHKTDNDTVDRSADLANLQAGDTIEVQGQTWTIVGSTDQGTYIDYEIIPATQAPADGVFLFTFEYAAAQAIDYVNQAAFYAGDADVDGFFSQDGSLGSIVIDDNAYGIDIEVVPVTWSDDWEPVAYNCAGGLITSTEGIQHAPADGQMWGSRNGVWQPVISTDANNALVQGSDGGLYVPITGGGGGNGIFDAANQNGNVAVTNVNLPADLVWTSQGGNDATFRFETVAQQILQARRTTASNTYFQVGNSARIWDFGVNTSGHYIIRDNTGSTSIVQIQAGAGANSLLIRPTSQILLNAYGVGAFQDDTAPWLAGFTASGDLVEVDPGIFAGADGNGIFDAANNAATVAIGSAALTSNLAWTSATSNIVFQPSSENVININRNNNSAYYFSSNGLQNWSSGVSAAGTYLIRHNTTGIVQLHQSMPGNSLRGFADGQWRLGEYGIGNFYGIAGAAYALAVAADGNLIEIDLPTGGAADGVVTNVTFNGSSLVFTGQDGGFNGSVNIASLADGNGIYDGSGVVPAGAVATISTTLQFTGDSADRLRVGASPTWDNPQGASLWINSPLYAVRGIDIQHPGNSGEVLTSQGTAGPPYWSVGPSAVNIEDNIASVAANFTLPEITTVGQIQVIENDQNHTPVGPHTITITPFPGQSINRLATGVGIPLQGDRCYILVAVTTTRWRVIDGMH